MTIPDEAVQDMQRRLRDKQYLIPTTVLQDVLSALPFLLGVKVKALDWAAAPNEAGRDGLWLIAIDSLGKKYEVIVSWHGQKGEGWDYRGNWHKTLEAAKASAQADYEARILSAIKPAPSPRAQALEEAARIADDFARNNKGYDSPEAHAAFVVSSEIASYIRALSSQPVADHFADAGNKVADGWLPIETAPKDGTVIDLWSSEFGRQPDCFWGKREHHCGEAGQYCDSDWHSEPEDWIDSAQNTQTFDDMTHWRPLPASPGASE